MTGLDTRVDVSRLRYLLAGEVLAPGDEGYEAARGLFYGGIDPRPAAIARVAHAEDVAAVLEYTADTGAEFAVRSGGHSVAGHSSVDGGVVIDLARLHRIDVDPVSRTVRAGTGLTAAEVTHHTGEHGLAVGFGDTGSVGIGGITLGGGVGFLSRRHGLTIDALLAAEMVTADGRILSVDAESHPDLFWAMRGGGGNFGVATWFEFGLAPVDRVVGGMMILPATVESVLGLIEETSAAPDDLTAIVNVMSCPPMPGIPDDVVGRPVIMALVTWCGAIAEGHGAMKGLRSLADPLVDTVAEIPYPAMYQPEDGSYHPTAVGLTGFSSKIDRSRVVSIIEAIEESDAPLRVAQIRALGGAIARVPNDATAFGHRDREFMVNVAAFYEDEDDRPLRESWVAALAGAITDGEGGYVGFVAEEGIDRARAAYPGDTWNRLREVKSGYDPHNRFRRNVNIPPSRKPTKSSS